jgi:hypothetical protein
MPRAEPTWRKVLWLPEPWPLRSTGTSVRNQAGELGGGEPDPDAVQDQPGNDRPHRGVAAEYEAQPVDPDHLERQTGLHNPVGPQSRGESGGQAAGEQGAERARHERGAGLRGGEAERAPCR